MAANPPAARTGTAPRVVMGVIAALSIIATIGAVALSVLGLLLTLDDSASPGDPLLMVARVALIAVPLLALGTTVTASIAAVTGRRGMIRTASGLFAILLIVFVLFCGWLGAISP